jgi:hypothetical protein
MARHLHDSGGGASAACVLLAPNLTFLAERDRANFFTIPRTPRSSALTEMHHDSTPNRAGEKDHRNATSFESYLPEASFLVKL